MGYLHDGHVSLLDEGRRRGDVLVLSIFVNPTQFGPNEDLSRYPRDLEGDLAKAAARRRRRGLRARARPPMYPDRLPDLRRGRASCAKGLCGASRPGHFRGVATVVLKLLQRRAAERRALRREGLPAAAGHPAHDARPRSRRRDRRHARSCASPTGWRMSSRNAYLSPDERQRALALSRALVAARARSSSGERDAAALVAARARTLARRRRRAPRLPRAARRRDARSSIDGRGRRVRRSLAVAAFVGTTRLIDNQLLAP